MYGYEVSALHPSYNTIICAGNIVPQFVCEGTPLGELRVGLSLASGLMQGEHREACVDRGLEDSWPLGCTLTKCGGRVVTEVKAMWKAGRAGGREKHQGEWLFCL